MESIWFTGRRGIAAWERVTDYTFPVSARRSRLLAVIGHIIYFAPMCSLCNYRIARFFFFYFKGGKAREVRVQYIRLPPIFDNVGRDWERGILDIPEQILINTLRGSFRDSSISIRTIFRFGKFEAPKCFFITRFNTVKLSWIIFCSFCVEWIQFPYIGRLWALNVNAGKRKKGNTNATRIKIISSRSINFIYRS